MAKASTALVSIFAAVAGEFASREKTLAAVKARIDADAGKQEGARADVLAAYMMRKVKDGSLTEGARLLGLKGYKDGDASDLRRTAQQEKDYGAARTYWKQVLKDLGLATTATQGGARETSYTDSAAKEAAAKDAPVTVDALHIPTCENMVQVAEFMALMSTTLVRFQKANAKIITGDAGSSVRESIADFVASVKAL
jgi:hypothetical protein